MYYDTEGDKAEDGRSQMRGDPGRAIALTTAERVHAVPTQTYLSEPAEDQDDAASARIVKVSKLIELTHPAPTALAVIPQRPWPSRTYSSTAVLCQLISRSEIPLSLTPTSPVTIILPFRSFSS